MTTEIRKAIRRRRRPGEVVTPARNAIRSFCLECCAYEQAEAARCTCTACHLWPYRFGVGHAPAKVVESEDTHDSEP